MDIVRGNSMNATAYVEMFNIESGFGTYDHFAVFDDDAFVGNGSGVESKELLFASNQAVNNSDCHWISLRNVMPYRVHMFCGFVPLIQYARIPYAGTQLQHLFQLTLGIAIG